MSAIIQQFTSDDKMILIPNDIYAPITENRRTSMSIFSIDESFQKFELKICELNKSVDYELAFLNKKMDSFSEYLNKLVSSSLPSQQEKYLGVNIFLLKKTFVQKMKQSRNSLRPKVLFLTVYQQILTIKILTL